jgi:hypothetical protein
MNPANPAFEASSHCRSAVLLIGFNRAGSTARVIDAIRHCRPARLYFAVDGPRSWVAADASRCAAVRDLVSQFDWPCEVRTLFAEQNQGCRLAVKSALDWFFASEQEGIILEDDIVPQAGFFTYCDQLLERFRDDPRICGVSGCNLSAGATDASYRFSRYTLVWGWATWRRAWKEFDDDALDSWPDWKRRGGLKAILPNWRDRLAWADRFESTRRKTVSSWAYVWTFCQWRSSSYCVIPSRNHTMNIGFGSDSTHTELQPAYVRDSPPVPVEFPLRHPAEVAPSDGLDDALAKRVFRPRIVATVRLLLKAARAKWRDGSDPGRSAA